MVAAYIGLGANLGDARATLEQALRDLDAAAGCRVLRRSSFYRTAPIDSHGPDYLNAVAEVETTLRAPDLLAALQAIEAAHGRERPYHNAPRTLDLDLLRFGSAHIESPALTVPHPRLHERAFVLLPLAELAPELVAPEWLHAVAGQRIERITG